MPPKFYTEVTKEMIDDYHAEQNQPVVLAGKTYKYHPIDFEFETFDNPKPVLLDDHQILVAENDMADIIKDIMKEEKDLNILVAKQKELQYNFNIRLSRLEADKTTNTAKGKPKTKAMITTITKNQDTLIKKHTQKWNH